MPRRSRFRADRAARLGRAMVDLVLFAPRAHAPMLNPVTGLIRLLAGRDCVWGIFPPALRRLPRFAVQRRAALETRFERRIRATLGAGTVLQGPFAGLRFPDSITMGSALLPRLVGSYESELHDAVERLVAKEPPLFIDIGFAEGYYLVGLGRRLPRARLVGYDLNPAAHQLCTRLASANGLPPSRLELRGACDPTALREWLPARALILCDCEGFEAELFGPGQVHLWAGSNLLIECHEFLQRGVTAAVQAALSGTHRLTVIASTGAEAKLAALRGNRFAAFTEAEKLRLLAEGRPEQQSWVVAEPIL